MAMAKASTELICVENIVRTRIHSERTNALWCDNIIVVIYIANNPTLYESETYIGGLGLAMDVDIQAWLVYIHSHVHQNYGKHIHENVSRGPQNPNSCQSTMDVRLLDEHGLGYFERQI